jgi:hypothetical protein
MVYAPIFLDRLRVIAHSVMNSTMIHVLVSDILNIINFLFLFFILQDINECEEPNIDGTYPRRCNDSQVCQNTNGSYTCACSPVFNTTGTCICKNG